MALSVIKIGRQKTLASLAKAAFKLEASDAALQAKAEAALIRANPHLASEAGTKAGAEIVVPKVPGLAAADPAQLADKAEASLQRLAVARMRSLAAAASAAFAKAIATARRELKELKSLYIKQLLDVRPDLAKELGVLRKAAEEDVAALEVRGKALEKVLKQAGEDLEWR